MPVQDSPGLEYVSGSNGSVETYYLVTAEGWQVYPALGSEEFVLWQLTVLEVAQGLP